MIKKPSEKLPFQVIFSVFCRGCNENHINDKGFLPAWTLRSFYLDLQAAGREPRPKG
jgi:hypothetical protein